MSLDGCFDREMSILDEQLSDGEISRAEYDEAVRELELEAADIEREQMDHSHSYNNPEYHEFMNDRY